MIRKHNADLQKRYLQYIKDMAVTRCIASDRNILPRFKYRDMYAFFKRALANYARFRLALMTNKSVVTTEHALLTAAVKAGIELAIKKFNVDIPVSSVDAAVDEYLPQVLNLVHAKRVDVFTDCLEFAASNLDKDNESK